ncbi:MAG: hypothetical protein AAF962_14450 [Actinomycetota bacterium]
MQQGLDDDLYQAVGRYYEVEDYTEREKLAIEFGERYAIDHTAIDDELFGRLREHFTDTEVLELTMIAGFCVGIGRALQVLDVAADFDVNWTRDPAPVESPS